ncbi:MAG: hypothetical protein JNL54_16460 [Kineosporiaceae bacterium]|nr:hypothetical protein [Kineosporiaceae bacterium]
MSDPTSEPTRVQLDSTTSVLRIDHLTITHPDVLREARRWTTGSRGPAVDDAGDLKQADLSPFVLEAMVLGSRTLAVVGEVSDARGLEQMVKEVGRQTSEAAVRASELTERAARQAAETVTTVANDAKKAITEADQTSRKEFVAAVDGAKQQLASELRRLVGGDKPELLDRLQPLLDRFTADLDRKLVATASEVLDKAAKQFDPSDPTSPMAKHAHALNQQQKQLTEHFDRTTAEITAKVEALTTAITVQGATKSLASVTPIKGGSFEQQVHSLMLDIAAGLGAEYADTTSTTGQLPRSKKGDGVLTLENGAARIVLEVTDSSRTTWGSYLDEAERNRAAAASLGLVRSMEQNGGQGIRVQGPRRLVMAFDPDVDDPTLLRSAVQLLATTALAVSTRSTAADLGTVDEKIAAAVAQLQKLDDVKKLAGTIQRNAARIETESGGISLAIQRLLEEAQVLLHAASDTTPSQPGPSEPGHIGAA